MKNLLLMLPFAGLLACNIPQNGGTLSTKPSGAGFGGPRGGGVTWGQSPRSQATAPATAATATFSQPAAPAPVVGNTAPPEQPVAAPAKARPEPLLAFLFQKPESSANPAAATAKVQPISAAPGKAQPAVTPPAASPAPQRKSLFAMWFGPKETPRATVVEAAPAPKPTQPAKPKAAPELPKQPDDGLRMPDMLTMPEKNEFQSTNPAAVKSQNPGGAVIARPPTDPPSRPKTKESDP